MTKTQPDSKIADTESLNSPERALRRRLRTAAVAYSVAWIVGLLVASSSTDVTSSGSAIVQEDTPHLAALAIAAAQRRQRLRLPFWLLPTGIATGVALLVSAIGYLTVSNALSGAAWVSLPLLLIYVTAIGLCVQPGSER